jgi:hypothetical protein
MSKSGKRNDGGVAALAKNVMENMMAGGFQIQQLPPQDISIQLRYDVLSDFLDLLILDMFRVCPEIFSTTSTVSVRPGILKAYLYVVAMHHFKVSGILAQAGGFNFPDASGVCVPTPLLAWLQFIGTYEEGPVHARARYAPASAVATLAKDEIASGAVSEAALNNSNFALALFGYQLNTAQGEIIALATNVDTANVITLWNTNSDAISGLLDGALYPTYAMWEKPPKVPDASYWAQPSVGGYSAFSTSTDPLFGCAFQNWDSEIACLYQRNSVAPVQESPPFDLRPGPMTGEWPKEPTLASGFEDAYALRKMAFCLIVRNLTYEPGLPAAGLKVYHGDVLKSLRVIPMPIMIEGWHEFVARCAVQIFANGATYDSNQMFALLTICEHALLRKLQMCTIGFYNDTANLQRYFLPSDIDRLNVPAPVAMALNDFGPVIVSGHLQLPLFKWTPLKEWFRNWNVFGDTAIEKIFDYSLRKTAGSADPNFTWNVASTTQTISAAWVTAYVLLTNFQFVSWVAVFRLQELVIKLVSNGVAYGKGDILFSVGKGPRGGVCMFSQSVGGSLSSDLIISEASDNSLTFDFYSLRNIGSPIPIVGPEIVMSLLCRWRPTVSRQAENWKFGRAFSALGGNSYVDRFVNVILGPGGTFLDMFSQAMKDRHMHHDTTSGLVNGNDQVGACLWDAIKGIAGTIASAVQPAAEAACGFLPGGPLTNKACGAAVKAVAAYAGDMGRTATNRKRLRTRKEELRALGRTLDAETNIWGYYDHVPDDAEMFGIQETNEERQYRHKMLQQQEMQASTIEEERNPIDSPQFTGLQRNSTVFGRLFGGEAGKKAPPPVPSRVGRPSLPKRNPLYAKKRRGVRKQEAARGRKGFNRRGKRRGGGGGGGRRRGPRRGRGRRNNRRY